MAPGGAGAAVVAFFRVVPYAGRIARVGAGGGAVSRDSRAHTLAPAVPER